MKTSLKNILDLGTTGRLLGQILRLILIKTHRYLGFVAGAILCVVALSGALYAFEPQLRAWWGEPVSVAGSSAELLSPVALQERLRASGELGSAVSFRWPEDAGLPMRIFWREESGAGRDFMVDPVTGERLPRAEAAHAFFAVVLDIHRTLTMGQAGQWIVGGSAACLLVLAVSGVFVSVRRWRDTGRIWIPAERERMSRQPWARWRCWHRIVGAWALPWLILMPLTGMVWSFASYQDFIKWLGGPPRFPTAPAIETSVIGESQLPLERIWQECLDTGAGPGRMRLTLPEKANQPVRFEWSPASVPSLAMRSRLFLDPATGAVVETQPWEEFSAGEQLVRWAYPLHTGRIFGLPGQVVAFLGSLTLPFFFVSGIFLFLTRRKKRSSVTNKMLQPCNQSTSTVSSSR